MTREELGNSINLLEELIPENNPNRTKKLLIPTKICIHNTDNPDKGADAVAHSRYLIKKAGDNGDGPTSWHYTVDDQQVIKHLPLGERGIHAYSSGNSVSIGIEMCMNSDGDWLKTVDRTARLVTALCFDFGWNIDEIKQHNNFPRSNGTHKNCPSLIRSNYKNIDWNEFLKLAESYYKKVLISESFPLGFAVSKKVAHKDEKLIVEEEKIDSQLDFDHGKIIIPYELLNLK